MIPSRLVIWMTFVGTLACAQSPGTFTFTGNLITARFVHTATLLDNGKILIAGGLGPSIPATYAPADALSSAELYDPSTHTFTPTGEMTVAREGHTATLLPDGRVFIAGGYGTGPIPQLASAEIYDPSTGTFTATGGMTTARGWHAATLLNSGKVLIAGGGIPGVDLASAELYDPYSGTFTPTGNMTIGRFEPLAVLLINGRVLIVPGDDEGVSSADLYDPDAGTFRPTGWVSAAVTASTANLLTNGNVVVSLAEGGCLGGAGAQLYDPTTEAFTPTGSLFEGECDQIGTSLSDGTVLITGAYVGAAQLYDPSSNTLTPAGDMLTARGLHAATLLTDGTVLVSGGVSAPGWCCISDVLASAEIYTPTRSVPPTALLSLSGDGTGQGAVQHASTYQLVSANNPAVAGEIIVIYGTGLLDASVIPPQVSIGGRLAEIVWFGNTPGYPGLNQFNVRVPVGIAPGSAVPVRINYIGRPSNEVTIGVQ